MWHASGTASSSRSAYNPLTMVDDNIKETIESVAAKAAITDQRVKELSLLVEALCRAAFLTHPEIKAEFSKIIESAEWKGRLESSEKRRDTLLASIRQDDTSMENH
jgi:hypothetical protein